MLFKRCTQSQEVKLIMNAAAFAAAAAAANYISCTS
jgi:hypothetical protein